jgi:hypothetical protein
LVLAPNGDLIAVNGDAAIWNDFMRRNPWSRWLIRILQASQRRSLIRRRRPSRGRFWPGLESLEDRCTPTQVTLTSVADNTLYEETNASAQLSNGAGPNFYVGDSAHQPAGFAIRRGVLRFDLSSIPASATINSVKLTLHMSKTKAATAETVSLHKLLQNWGEGTSVSTGQGAMATTNDATWLDTFWSASNPSTWTTPGGTFSSTVSASASVANTVGFASWTGTGLVADVTQWLSQPSTNFGWIVIGNESMSETALQFDSRSNMTASFQPTLTVNFTAVTQAATQIVFGVQPGNTTAGATISPAVTVKVEDSNGNVVTTDTSNVTIAIGTNPGGGTVSGTLTVAAVSGIATFSTLSLNKAGVGYTLTAADDGLTKATSRAFNITPGTATQLVLGVQPSNTTAAATISPAVTVKVEDSLGNVVSTDASNVTVAIGTNPSAGTLSGTTTVAAVSGTATFSTLSINKVGTGYTLTAADGALTPATSSAFNVTAGTAARLVFSQQPTNTTAGATIAPAVTVLVEDSAGNVINSDSSNVTIAIGANPGLGNLSGTLTVAAVSGVATLSTLSINKAGTGYTLTAADGALTPATSSAFNVTAGTAARLVFSQQPTNTTAGATIAPAVTVLVEDSAGNVINSDSSNVTIAIGANTGLGNLSGTLTVAAVSGVATFSTLSINKAGTGYTLTAADGALTPATSSAFNVTAGTAAKLVFSQQPTNTTAGATISPAVTVLVEDSAGNVINSDSSNVTIAIGANPGLGNLGGTLTVAAVSGVATFSTLSINKVGTGYSLTAADGTLANGTSNSFNITAGSATQLVFGVQPSNAIANTPISPAVTVQVEDSLGNMLTTDTSNVTVAIGTNPAGGTLSGTTTQAAVNGVATFNNLSINNAGNGFTLKATDGQLAPATSDPLNIKADGFDNNGNLVVNGVAGQGNVIVVNSNAHTFTVNGQTQSYNTVALTGHFIVNGVGNVGNYIQILGIVSAEVHAGNGNDTITGGAGDDVIYGGSGNDVIQGGSGNDVLIGGTGRSRVSAGAGHNIVIGGGESLDYTHLHSFAEYWAANGSITVADLALMAMDFTAPGAGITERLTGGTGVTATSPSSTNYYLGSAGNPPRITNFNPSTDQGTLL